MSSFWKPLAIVSLAAAATLAGLLLRVSSRDNPGTTAMRRNVEDQVRYHLAQKEPAKAAALLSTYGRDLLEPFQANALRLETARASAWEDASQILDELLLPAMDREQAAEAAQIRLDLQRRQFEASVLVDGALPAPFEPAPFRMTKTPSPSVDDLRRITSKLLALVTERRDLARRHGAAADPDLDRIESLATAARYALGELPFDAVKVELPEVRVLFGDLLFRERQFDRALEVWTPVLDEPRVKLRIAELAALRRLAPKQLHLWDYDVEKLLGRDPALDARVTEWIQALFKNARPGELPMPAVRGIPKDEAVATPSDEPTIFFPDAHAEGPIRAEPAIDPNQTYLLVNHRQFDFQNVYDRPFLTRADPQLRLRSAYTGPIRFRLFKVRDLATLTAMDAASIAAKRAELQPVREWRKEFTPIGPNGRHEYDWLVEVPSCPAGLYVLMADARYCPVYAFARLIVTDTGLLQQPALDRVLVHSVDRVTGAPVAGMELTGDVSGRYVLKPADLLPTDDSIAEEFRRGFDAAWAAKPSEPDATPSYLRGFQSATSLRADRPDVRLEFKGVTDRDGLFEWTVAPAWREGYQYTLRTTSTQGGTCTRVESTYAVQGDPGLVTLVYADRPLYRCGESVSFKALIRRRDGEGLHPYGGRDALVEVGTGQRVLYARTHAVTDFGTASGTIELPEECARGNYWVKINNGTPQQLFKVEDYHKAEFEISFTHPKKVRAGDPIELLLQVRRFSGEPLAKTQVTVTVQNAAAGAAVRMVDEWGGVGLSGGQESAWRAVEHRVVTTDDDGRALFRFQTEEGLAARYVVTAGALEESRREVTRRTSFESSAQTRQVVVETDRPIYYPGEVAKVRFRLADASTARAEERAKTDQPFAATLALQDGAGSFDYPVPESDRVLQIGVREGPGWSWTPVPIRIKPRTAASSFVHLRLDRPLYRVGDTAKVEITSSEPNASVLLVAATGRIHRRQVVRLNDRRLEVPLEVREEDIPNVHLLALAVKNDQVGRATVELSVPPLDRFLTVEVTTDRAEYGPGQECAATIRVTDAQGRPVPECELSLGVIDESVYALQADLTPDLREYFHRYSRPLRVQESFFYKEALPPFTVWKCPVFIRGQMNLYETMAKGIGGGGGGRYGGRFGGRENLVARGGGASMSTSRGQARTDFRDTAYWNAHLKTGADGTATAKFAFPENLTRFRFTARGITRAHQVGEVRQETVVRKPFFVTIAAPRGLQEGNTIAIYGVVHNRTDRPQVARVSFKTPFPAIGPSAPAQVSLAPGDSRRVEVLLSIDRYLADAPITFGAECESGENDAMTIRVPGRRHGSPFHEGRSGSVAGGSPREEVFRIPAGAIPGTTTLTVDFDAGIHTAIAGALDGLVDYPYGCVEQTMTRFLPAVAARRALGDVPPRLRQKLPSVLAAGLQRLYALQQPDGGWGWFAGGSADTPLTSYVLYGLAICRKSGVGVDRSVADRAAKHLLERLEKTVFLEESVSASRLPLRTAMDLRSYELLALAEYHAAWNVPAVRIRRLIGTMADRRGRLSETDEILLALAAARIGQNEVAAPLAERAQRRLPDDVAAASFLLQLQAARGSDVAPAIRLLLGRRTGKGWASTIESAHALLGLAAAVERPNPAMDLPPGRVEIHVNGELVQELTLRGAADASFDGRVTIPAPPAGWGEKAVVRLVYDGQGTAFYTASLEASLGGENREPVSRGLEIKRDYLERDPDGAGWRPVEGGIAAGRTVLVVLRIHASARRDYLMATDPRPDGFEPLHLRMSTLDERWSAVAGLSDRVDLARGWEARLDEFRRSVRGDPARESAWAKSLLREIIEQRRFSPVLQQSAAELPLAVNPAHVEHRDDRTIFFIDALQPGWQCVWYFARAELPGETHALPPRIEAMYQPEIHASGRESQLTVADGRLVRSVDRIHLNAPGVDGLLEVLPHLPRIDADALLERIPTNPRIGDLLVSVGSEAAVRAWLSAAPATAAAGRDLRERIEAARRDLATRMLCVEALSGAPRAWLPALDAALGDDAPAARVLKDADPADLAAVDNILLWSMEDRAFRLALLGAAQGLRETARVEAPAFPRLDLPRVAAALGGRAPSGPALLAWKLGQRGRFAQGRLQDFAAACERDLGLTVRLLGKENPEILAEEAPISEILDRTLGLARLFYRIRNGEIVVGPLEELLR